MSPKDASQTKCGARFQKNNTAGGSPKEHGGRTFALFSGAGHQLCLELELGQCIVGSDHGKCKQYAAHMRACGAVSGAQ